MKKNYILNNTEIISEKINDYTFINNDNLTEIIIPEGVKHIGERAFLGCKNLKKIILPKSLVSIESSAFCECETLEEIILPSNLKKLNYCNIENRPLFQVIIP